MVLNAMVKLPGSLARLPLLGGGGGERRRGGTTAAQRLAAGLPTLRRPPSQWRSLLVHAVDLQQEIDSLQPPEGLTGRWKKCKKSSDPMDEACDMVALPWVLRKAIAVLNYLELEDSPTHFATNLKAGGVLDVVERYPWTGETVEHPRRDKRRGKHTAFVRRSEEGHPCIAATWSDPYGGECTDTFVLDGDTLTQVTDMRVGERRTLYKTVFHRVHPH